MQYLLSKKYIEIFREVGISITDIDEVKQDNYGWARLCQVIANFFGNGLSVGIDKLENVDCDNGDNGMYIIKDWEIIGREFFNNRPEQQDHQLEKIVEQIKSMW